MYTPTRHFIDFHVAGMRFSEATVVIKDIAIGDKLDLRVEPDNPHDPQAVALYYKDYRIGYIPHHKNSYIFSLLYFGHNVFEARVAQKNLELDPAAQLRVTVYVKDGREIAK